MAEATRVKGDLAVEGAIICAEGAMSPQARSVLRQEPAVRFPVSEMTYRVHDAPNSNLPSSAAADDLSLTGTFGTLGLALTAGDCKAAGAVTRYARFTIEVPECYQAAETFSIIATAGMKTTIADTSCTIDFEVYKITKAGMALSADLVTDAAQSINSLTFADYTFDLTSSGLAPGDKLDCRVAIACNDAATVGAVTPMCVIDYACDIRG